VGTYSYLVTQRICISIFGSQSCFDNDTKTVAITVSVGAAPGVPGAISGSSSLSYTTPATGASASLSWAASSGTVTQYQLQHRLNNGSWAAAQSSTSRSYSATLAVGSYDYRVRACNGSNCSAFTATKSVSVSVSSSGSSGFVTLPSSSTTGNYTVSWPANAGDISYTLKEKVGNGAWTSVSTSGNSKSYTGKPLGTYSYEVTQWLAVYVSFEGYSGYTNALVGSDTASIVVTVAPPGKPSSISVPSTDDNGAFSVNWGTSTGTLSGFKYKLYQKKDAGSWALIHHSSAKPKSVSGLNDGSYIYRVRACNNVSSTSACSGYRTSGAVLVANKPGSPSNLVVPSNSSTGNFTVAWSASSGTVDEYRVTQQKNGSGPWESVPSSGLSASVLLNSDGSYSYKVQACNIQGTYAACSSAITSSSIAVLIDSDGDGVSDATDAFPSNPDESVDSDGDGVGDNGDAFPFDPSRGAEEVITIASIPTPASIPYVDTYALSQSEVVGATQGSFRVSESGAATYTLPIFAVEGTAGVTPQMSLNYSSQSGNGIAGVGWSIGGLSSISRCRQTFGQDGKARPISLAFGSDGDKLCLDGQRLIRTSGTYGTSGSTYRTEIDSYAEVSFDGTSFTVTRKDGSVSEYGNGNDSTQSVSAVPYTWAISRFEDSVGNPIKFTYIDDADGHRISRVDYAYGSNQSGSGTSSTFIEFNYETRTDASTGYIAGDTVTQAKRLTSIDVVNDSVAVRHYGLSYTSMSGAITKSYLSEIEECISDNDGCLRPLDLGWTLPAATQISSSYQQVILDSQDDRYSNYQPADINADGLLDLVWLEADYDNDGKVHDQYFRYVLANGTGYDSTQTFYTDSSNHNNPYPWHVIDYNADGRQDVIFYRYGQHRWYVALSEPQSDGSWQLSSSLISTNITEEKASFADLDSDGLLDAYYKSGTKFYVRYLERDGTKSNNSSTAFHFGSQYEQGDVTTDTTDIVGIIVDHNIHEIVPGIVADINGDGRVEVLLKVNVSKSCVGGYELCPGGGNSSPTLMRRYEFYTPTKTGHELVSVIASGGQNSFKPNAQVKVSDFNGDGYADLYLDLWNSTSSGDWVLKLNNGLGEFPTSISIRNDVPDQADMQAVDYTGDGYPDLIWHNLPYGSLLMREWDPSTSSLLSAVTIRSVNTSAGHVHQFYDLSGDGLIDYVNIASDRLYSYLGVGTAGPVGVITSFNNSMGSETLVDYESMSLSDNYQHVTVGGATQDFTWDNQSYTFSLANKGDFYEAINGDWDLPVGSDTLGKLTHTLEVIAPTSLVTRVRSTAPIAGDSSHRSAIAYHYGEAKVQAAGRGLLGFHKIKTVDEQSGVETTTTYRQDFPFIGSPSTTEVRSASGSLLSEATNTWGLHGWNGSSTPLPTAPYQPFISQSTEKGYDLSGNGTQQGALLKTVVTDTLYDDNGSGTSYGNVEQMIITTTGDGSTYSKETNNTFGSSVWESQMGRLSRSVVTTARNSETPVSRTSEFTYYSESEGGLLRKEIIEPDQNSYTLDTEYTYDIYGNRLTATTSGNGVVSRTQSSTYEDGRYSESSTNANGHKVSEILGRNALGQPTSVIQYLDLTASSGVVTTLEYDRYGRKVLEYSPTGASTITLQSASSVDCPTGTESVQSIQSGGGGTASSCHDALGRKIRTVKTNFDGSLIYQDIEYDNLGRVSRQSIPYNNSATQWSINNYDLLGRLTSVVQQTIDYGNLVTSSSYNGRSTTVTNPKSQTLTTVVNNLGEKVTVTDTLGGVISYGYDVQGNLTSTTVTGSVQASGVPSAITTVIGYDDLGRKTSMNDPDKGSWSYGYNVYGELISQTDAKSQTTTMTYDKLGRMKTRVDSAGDTGGTETTTWNYDTAPNGLGQLDDELQSSSGFGKVVTYDSFGRPSAVDTILGIEETYSKRTTFDAYGRVFQSFDGMRGTSGKEHLYNSYGYLESVRDAETINGDQHELHLIRDMDIWGNVTEEVIGSGATIWRTYAPDRGLLTDIVTNTVSATILQSLQYEYDELGNLLERTNVNTASDPDTTQIESFCYDDLNRLTQTVSGTGGCGTADLSYDSFGNIISKAGVGTYSYGAGTAGPHAVTSADGVTYGYDANGNMNNDTNRTIQYSSFDKPLYMLNKSNGDTTTFNYGSNRSRYKRVDSIGGQTSTTYYMGGLEKVVKANGDYTIKRFLSSNTLWLSHHNSNGDVTSSERKYLLKDSLGSIDVIMDNYVAVQEMSFDAWGQRRNVTSLQPSGTFLPLFDVSNLTRGFTGHEHVDSMGLIHMNGRIYDPKLGRFLQADPVVQFPTNTQSYNRYSYVLNNPLKYTDPSGYFLKKLFKNKVFRVVAAVVIAYVTYGAASEWSAAMLSTTTTTTASVTVGGAGTFAGGVATTASVTTSVTTLSTAGAIASGAIAGASAGFVSGAILTGSLKGAAQGAFTGAAFGGVGGYFGSSWNASRVGANGLAGGLSAKASGRKFIDGVKFSLLSDMARFSYRKIVGYDSTLASGGRTAKKGFDTYPVEGANNFGTQGETLTGDYWRDFFKEGGALSLQANRLPGVNAVSGVHDVFQVRLGGVGSIARNVFNVPGMIPAAGLTYASLMTDPAFAGAVSSYSDD